MGAVGRSSRVCFSYPEMVLWDPQVAQQCWRSWLQGPAVTPTGAVSFSRTDKVQEAEGLEAGGWHGLGYRRGQAKKISINRARGAGGRKMRSWGTGQGPAKE